MTISTIAETAFLSTTAVDSAYTIDDLVDTSCKSMPLTEGLEVQIGEDVFEFRGDNDIYPEVYSSSNTYAVGDVVIQNCKLHVVQELGKAKEPEEYSAWETSLSNWKTWSERYFRVPYSSTSGTWNKGEWKYDKRWYFVVKDTATGHLTWVAKDTAVIPMNCPPQWYLKSSLRYSTTTHFSFNTDYRAKSVSWCAPGLSRRDTLQIKSVIIRNGYMYFRTTANVPVEYKADVLHEVKSPDDIDGFVYKRKVCGLKPFDGKNYTACDQSPDSGMVEWKFMSGGYFDTISLNRVIADDVSVIVKDNQGLVVFEIGNYPVDNTLGSPGVEFPASAVLYTQDVMTKGEYEVTVRIHGGNVSLGGLNLGLKIKAGLTNTLFENKFVDYSPKEKDQWGNIFYKVGIKTSVFSGTCDMLLSDYDRINRVLIYIGGREVIINGSDSDNNTPPNSLNIFQATMMVARFASMVQRTIVVDTKIDSIATYSFSIEEIV